jgi:hypothetical protein
MRIVDVYRTGGSGRRLCICGQRIHHGLTGVALAVVGVALALHDRRDWPWSLRGR